MRWGFRELLEKRAADIIMPDLQKCGGLLEARKIADMAHTYYVPVAPHAVTLPVGMMATARARRRSRARHGFAHQERVTKMSVSRLNFAVAALCMAYAAFAQPGVLVQWRW